MPTTRARHLLTETDDVADAIDLATRMFPGETRADILRHLIQLGATSIADGQERRRAMEHARAERLGARCPTAAFCPVLRTTERRWPPSTIGSGTQPARRDRQLY